MNTIIIDETHVMKLSAETDDSYFPDPLAPDDPSDVVVVTTRRAIGRVAYVAAETASRFQRDAVQYDPMAWMFAPRAIFDGASAVDACLDRDACERGVLVQGLSLGLDIDRATYEVLMADDDEFDDHEFRHLYSGHAGGEHNPFEGRARPRSRLRLYTATIADTRNNVMIQAFHASVARSAIEVRARLVGRFGPDLAEAADIRPGLHASSPLVIALVPASTAEVIKRIGRDCASPAARTFAVDIQQCIQA